MQIHRYIIYLIYMCLLATPFYSLKGQLIPAEQQKEEGIKFPFLWKEDRFGKKSYMNYMTRRSYREVSEDYFQHVDRENRWIGPDDLFLEYEIREEYTREKEGKTEEVENTYRCLVWYIPDESGNMRVALRILSDKFRSGERTWEGKPDTFWRSLGSLNETRNFIELMEFYFTLPEAAFYTEPTVTFPILIDQKDDGNRTYLYELYQVAASDISEDGYMDVNGKKRKIQDFDLFLEYEILDNTTELTMDGTNPSGNLYRCIVCFTNQAGRNSEIMIRVLSDRYWGEGKEPEGETDANWRYVGYLDEIANFRKIVEAYRRYVEPEIIE